MNLFKSSIVYFSILDLSNICFKLFWNWYFNNKDSKIKNSFKVNIYWAFEIFIISSTIINVSSFDKVSKLSLDDIVFSSNNIFLKYNLPFSKSLFFNEKKAISLSIIVESILNSLQ